MRWTSRTLLLSALGVAAAACSLLSDFKGFASSEPDAAVTGDADTKPTRTLASGPWHACGKTVTKPLSGTGGTAIRTAKFAMFKLVLGETSEDAGAPIAQGADLDSLVSQPDKNGSIAQSCILPSSNNGAVDFPDSGIDNISGSLVVNANASKTVQERVASGDPTFVVQISNYSGAKEALSVDVTIGDTHSFVRGPNDAGKPFADAGDSGALDTWYVPNEGRADDAWVSQSVLVAHFPILRLPIAVAPGLVPHSVFHFPVTDAYVVSCLDDLETRNNLHVTIVGRLKASEFFAETGGVPEDDGTLRCKRDDWSTIKGLICRQRDIRAHEKEDHLNKPCDSMSVTLNFDLYRVQTISDSFTPSKPWIEFDAGACRAVSFCEDELDAGAR